MIARVLRILSLSRCSPSAALSWDAQTLTMTVFAVRRIKKNEEITIAYIDPLGVKAERQRKLELLYGFRCACEKCKVVADGPVRQSDEQRQKLMSWLARRDRSFQTWLDATTEETDANKLRAYEAELTTLLKFIPTEGLQTLRSVTMEITDSLLRIVVALGEDKKAVAVLKMARGAWALDPVQSKYVQRLIEEYDVWAQDWAKAPEWATRRL
jgi:hypothetical protein